MKTTGLGAAKVLTFLLLFLGAVYAQTFTGGVSGTVKDPSGAVVPQTRLVLTNLDTNEKREAESNDSGFYSFSALPPGRYRLETEKSGFKKFAQEPVEVRVQQFVEIDPGLQVGEASETLEVKGQVSVIDPTTSSLGHVVENRQITELPVNGRNTLAFVALTPGVRIQGGFGDNPATVNFQSWGNFSANGGVAGTNEILVDGAPVTTVLFNGVGYMPPVDATQEFKVQTNNFSAEFGRTGGAVVNLSIKSGTNEFHGSVYEFFRNDALDANNFFLNQAGKPKPALRYSQFGASAGGPIKRNRSFFFANYEGFRQKDGQAYVTTVPTELERRGDFSQTFLPNGQLRVIRDALTKQPFAENKIPAALLDPAGVKLMAALFPLPNAPGSGPAQLNNFVTSAVQESNQDQVVVRLDHTLSNVWRIGGSYGMQYFDLGGWDPLGNRTTPVDSGRAEKDRMQNLVLSATAFFSPTLIGEFRANYTRIAADRTPMSDGLDLTTLGFPKSLADAVQVKAFPALGVSGYFTLHSSTSSRQVRNSNSYSGSGSLTMIRATHSLKLGGQFRALGWNEFSNNNGSPNFLFDGRFTGTLNFGLPAMLLGYPSSGFITQSIPLSLIRKYTAGYLQDDWKVSSKLTLNLGLQWSVDTPYTERFNNLSWFDLSALPRSSQRLGLPYRGNLVFADENRRTSDDNFWKQWSPRFGFAYQLRQNTVVRGGYGVFWMPSSATMLRTSAPTFFRTRQNYVASLDGGTTPANKVSNPFPTGVTPAPGKAADWDTQITSLSGITIRDSHAGYMQNWNLNVQQDLGAGLALDVAYAGSKGTGLPGAANINQLAPQHLALGSALNGQVQNPYFGYVTTGPLSTPTVSRAQLLRPYPQFDGLTLGPQNIGSSNHHALHVKAVKRLSNSLVALAYTFSKTIDDSDATLTNFSEISGQATTMDFYNLRLDRSVNAFDIPHRLVVSYTLELPWKDRAGVLGRLVSGWEATGIYTAQSGTPMFLRAANTNNVFAGANRPNNNGRSGKLEGKAQERLGRWFDASVFSQPVDFTFGNTARALSDVRIHGINSLDGGFFKNNRFGREGRYNVQFRAEFFNAFNRVRFSYPGSQVGQANFGVVNSQLNRPRQIQFAVKFLF
ncbi:MAG: TonB-dependent receptor [Acidobacteria bacterium]|nr:TonB-dependent receptor [Acidobacteriota bacterium]